LEVALGGFRVDAVAADGRLIEIQLAPLGLLKQKLASLLPSWVVEVVKPVIVGRKVIQRLEPGGIDLSARRSPKRGSLIEVFDELVGLVHLFPHSNLTINLLAVEVDEIRVKRRRRPGYSVVDQILKDVGDVFSLKEADDLWSLLPEDLADQFTSQDLAKGIGCPLHFAQRVTYCLRQSGAASVVAKVGNRLVYERRAVVEAC